MQRNIKRSQTVKKWRKIKPNDYKLLKRYDIIMNLSNIVKLIVPVTDPNTIKYQLSKVV